MSGQSKTMELRAQVLQAVSKVCPPRARTAAAKMLRKKSAVIIDTMFREIATKEGIHTMLECGAHEATASAEFMKSGGQRAIAIEANPAVIEHKTHKTQKFGVEIINMGLADRVGTMDFHMPPGVAYAGNSSFHSRTGGTDVITVPTTTIDRVVADHGVDQPFAIWLDVEGFAFQVLQGAQDTLANPNLKMMKAEMEDEERWQGQYTADYVAPLIEASGLVPVVLDFEYVGQFNVVYLTPDIVARHQPLIDQTRDQILNIAQVDA